MLKTTFLHRCLITLLCFGLITMNSCLLNNGTSTGLAGALVGLTPNEDKGIKEIIGFYGGRCEYSIGMSTGINVERTKYFKIKLENSQATQAIKNTEMACGNIAYMFYHALNSKEKENYQEIHVKLVPSQQPANEETYTAEQLQNMDKKLQFTERFISFIKNKQADSLQSYFSTELFSKKQISEFVNKLQTNEAGLSPIRDFVPVGFEVTEYDNYPVMRVSGIIRRQKNNTQFTLFIYNKVGEQQVFGVDYRL